MQIAPLSGDGMVHVIEIGVLALLAYVGLKIKVGQAELKDDFNTKHAENTTTIAAHMASDDAKFDAIKDNLSRINGKLDRMNGGSH